MRGWGTGWVSEKKTSEVKEQKNTLEETESALKNIFMIFNRNKDQHSKLKSFFTVVI